MELKSFLVLTFVSAAAESPDSRIVGGDPASIYEYPFIVSLVYTDPVTGYREQRCTGSIISSWHVLTTASCFDEVNIEDFKIHAGATHSLQGGSNFDIYYLVVHPEYEPRNRTADIAIMMLYDPIGVTDTINVVYLPPQETHIPDGYPMRAVGWGYKGEYGPKNYFLYEFDTRTIPQQQCLREFENNDNIIVYDQVICTQAQGRSMCGDSGAPLLINNVIMGFFSYSTTCDDSVPDVFTRIDRHTGWILQEAVSPYGARSEGVPVRVKTI
ncbi:hypothetical protein ABMA27_010754 [Loxostege sticticalis]|uniref:Peptidase S1 domain-containing protein n=1 Tax=Loxostege sticticalis TaxID=481309 RepID=A0ABR3H488_LOXSC